MRKVSRRRVRRVEIYDMQSFAATACWYIADIVLIWGTYDASTTSRPLGDIDAEPIASFTRIDTSLSKVGLSYAERTESTTDFLFSSSTILQCSLPSCSPPHPAVAILLPVLIQHKTRTGLHGHGVDFAAG